MSVNACTKRFIASGRLPSVSKVICPSSPTTAPKRRARRLMRSRLDSVMVTPLRSKDAIVYPSSVNEVTPSVVRT